MHPLRVILPADCILKVRTDPLTGIVRLRRRNAGALPKGEPKIKEATMKKRFLALLLAVCIGVSVLVLPASAAGSNTAVQASSSVTV